MRSSTAPNRTSSRRATSLAAKWRRRCRRADDPATARALRPEGLARRVRPLESSSRASRADVFEHGGVERVVVQIEAVPRSLRLDRRRPEALAEARDIHLDGLVARWRRPLWPQLLHHLVDDRTATTDDEQRQKRVCPRPRPRSPARPAPRRVRGHASAADSAWPLAESTADLPARASVPAMRLARFRLYLLITALAVIAAGCGSHGQPPERAARGADDHRRASPPPRPRGGRRRPLGAGRSEGGSRGSTPTVASSCHPALRQARAATRRRCARPRRSRPVGADARHGLLRFDARTGTCAAAR